MVQRNTGTTAADACLRGHDLCDLTLLARPVEQTANATDGRTQVLADDTCGTRPVAQTVKTRRSDVLRAPPWLPALYPTRAHPYKHLPATRATRR